MDDRTSQGGRTDKRRKGGPRPVTADWLFRAAAHYLERYASSSENLRRVLLRKIERRRRPDSDAAPDVPVEEADRAGDRRLVDETIERFVELKLLDDEAYAEARFASLRRRGTSLRQTAAKLAGKGVSRELVAAVSAARAGDDIGDEAAARAYARRRRLGPHRASGRAERRDRDLAALMRAGFSYRDARAAIDGNGGDDPPSDP